MLTQLLGFPLIKINHFAQSPCKFAPTTLRPDSRLAGNMGLAKVAVQWLNQAFCASVKVCPQLKVRCFEITTFDKPRNVDSVDVIVSNV